MSKMEKLLRENGNLQETIEANNWYIEKLQVENKALKARVKLLQDAIDTAYEDDAAGLEDLMKEIEETK